MNALQFNYAPFNTPATTGYSRNVWRYQCTQFGLSTNTWRYQCGIGGYSTNVWRYACTQFGQNRNVWRYSTRGGYSRNVWRYQTTVPGYSRNVWRYTAVPSTFLTVTKTGGQTSGSNPNADDYTASNVAQWDSTELYVNRAYHCRITLNESAPATWELGVMDEDGTFNPENSGTWEGVMSYQMFDTVANALDGHYDRTFLVSTLNGGFPYAFQGIPNKYKTSGKWPSQINQFDWSGVDYSHVLYGDEVTLPTLRSSPVAPLPIMSNDIIAAILQPYGLSYNPTNVENYPIPVFHRQAMKPIQMIEAILDVPVASWMMIGSTLTAWVPTPSSTNWTIGQTTGNAQPPSSVNWTCDWQTDVIYDWDGEGSQAGYVDRVLVSRAKEAGNNVKTVDVTAWKQYPKAVTFSPPVNGVTWHVVESTNGVFSDFTAYSPQGTIVAYAQPRIIGQVPGVPGSPGGVQGQAAYGAFNNVASITLTWGQPTPSASSSPGQASSAHGVITFIGSTLTNGQAFGGSSDTLLNLQVWRDLGIYPKEIRANELIPTSAWLTTHGIRMLGKLGRTEQTSTVGLPFNPYLRPGFLVNEINRKIGRNRNCYINKVVHDISPIRKNRKTTYSAYIYPDLSSINIIDGAS